MTSGWSQLLCLLGAGLLPVSGCAFADAAPDAGDPFTDAADPSPEPDAATELPPDAAATADAAPDPDAAVPTPDAAIPTPGPDAAPPPDAPPCSPTWIGLLGNGDFESGAATWTSIGGSIVSMSSEMPISAYAGVYAAWMAGYNAADEALLQTVVIPADATALRMRAQRCFVTADETGPADYLIIELRNTSGTTVETLASYSNEDIGTVCGWNPFEMTAASAHAGETIQLYFHATTNGLYPSSFYLDDVVLEAFACP
jgi:hypothetical protein